MSTVADRIIKRLEILGKTPRAASIEAGGSPELIRGILRNPGQSPTVDTIRKLSKPLDTSPEWLAFGTGDAGAGAEFGLTAKADVSILGEVAAGQWLEADPFVSRDSAARSLLPPLDGEDADRQFDLVVKGTSINRIARDGAMLRCVDYRSRSIGSIPLGSLVIVERKRAQGSLIETSAKRLTRRDGQIILVTDSDDQRWQGVELEIKHDDEDTEVRIIGRVLVVYYPP